jgi:hypothetical protein
MKKIIAVPFLALFVFFSVTSLVDAITVGPVKLQINANPGQTTEGTMFLKNDDNTAVTFYPSIETFTEKNGEKVFIKVPNDLESWIKVPSSVQLPAGGSTNIPFSITVPTNASPGGHFAIVWWSTTPPSSSSNKQVSIVTRAGILVYLNVSGNTIEEASFNLNSPIFAFGLPLNFNIHFENNGNVFLMPQGNLEIKNILGGNVGNLPLNQGGAVILPKTSQDFTLSWQGQGGFYFGPYQAVLAATYGQNNKTTTVGHWFFLISWNTLVVILVLILLVFILPRLIKRYNKWIIEKARGR